MKFIAYAFLSFTIAPIIGILIGIPFDKYLLKNYPVTLFTVIIFFSSLGIYSLYLYKKSYKYVNDAILAIFTGWVALTYLLTGEKTSEVIPSEKIFETHPLTYYLIILKLTIVANGLLAKIFITLHELYDARKAENNSGKYNDFLKMTISNIKCFFNSKNQKVKK